MAYWLLQVNPEQFDAAEHSYAEQGTWNVVHSLDKFRRDDGVCVWVSGRDAGVFLTGTITGEVFEEKRPRDYGDPEGPSTTGNFVPVTYSHRLMSEYLIRRDELRTDPRFAAALILRMAGGANPFPLTAEEWEAIADRLPDEARVGVPPTPFHVHVFGSTGTEEPHEAVAQFWGRLRNEGASAFAAEVRTSLDEEPVLVLDGEDDDTGESLVVLVSVETDAPRAEEALRMAWSDLEETPPGSEDEWSVAIVGSDGAVTTLPASDGR